MPVPSDAPVRSQADIGVRQPQVQVAHEGYSVLVTRMDARLGVDPTEGLFDFDTRILSWWRLRIDGQEPELVSSARVDARHWGTLLRVQRPGDSASGPRLPQDAIAVIVRRRLGRGMAEQIELRNHSMAAADLDVSLEVGADFADVQETKEGARRQHGGTRTRWEPADRRLTIRYRSDHRDRTFERGVRVTVAGLDGPIARSTAYPRGRRQRNPRSSERVSRLRFPVRLEPNGSQTMDLTWESLVDGDWRTPLPERGSGPDRTTARDRERERWLMRRMALDAQHAVLDPLVETAMNDLWDLRNWDLHGDRAESWVVNAGVPTYTGLFGRDSLLAGIQALLAGPEPLDGALRHVAGTQGERDDPWTEEEPGRMIHEIRRGPLADLGIIPQHRFYGAHTTSTLFPIALLEHWRWTGDIGTVRAHLPAARRALAWAAELGDLDGDGFLEYEPRSPEGLKNEAWKDSREAIRYPDGRLVENPVATVEEQAFHIAAIEAVATLLEAVADQSTADEIAALRARAADLRRRFHAAFWMADAGTYALALDPRERQVRTIASNAGHALAMGVVPEEHAASVGRRLLAPDLFSGWGVRTLSADHPAYNPLAYHLGTVWPFENALFARGLRRYGLDDEAETLMTALFRAAGHFESVRLPELFGGHAADELPYPTVYPDSNIPQAWTASAILMLVQTMLGIEADAPAGVLRLVRPRLPAWVPVLTMRRIRIGDSSVDLRFRREQGGSTSHDVLGVSGGIRVERIEGHPAGEGDRAA